MTTWSGARWALLVTPLVVLPSCGEPEHGVPQGVVETEPSWNPQVRRPRWRFVFEKGPERCVVLRIDDGEQVTRGEEAPCPVDLQPGERIRLAGSVCMREGPDRARVVPVVCPDPLTNAELEHLQAQGLTPR